MQGEKNVAIVNQSWFAIAIGKIDFAGKSKREKLQADLPPSAWQLADAMMNAGVIRPEQFHKAWKHQAIAWRDGYFVRNQWFRAMDYLAASFNGVQVVALMVFCALSDQTLLMTLPALLGYFIGTYHVMPNKFATQVLNSKQNKQARSLRSESL